MSRAVIRLTNMGLASLLLLVPACARSFIRTVDDTDRVDGSGGSNGDYSGDTAGQDRSGSYFWYGGEYAGNGWFGTEGDDYSEYGDTGGYGGAYEGETNYCGDGIVNTGAEQCDGDDLSGLSCEQLGMGRGTLACFQQTCTFDVSMCVPYDNYPPADPTPVTPLDYPRLRPPGTPQECVDLYFGLQPAISFILPDPDLDCLCAACLGPFGRCLTEYHCAQVVSCCYEAGLRAADCPYSAHCSDVMSELLGQGTDSVDLALDVNSCAASNCPLAR